MPEPFDLEAMMKPALDRYQTMFANAANGMREVGGFSEPEQWRFDWERSYSRDEWLDQLPTQAPLTRLQPDKLAEVLKAVGGAIDSVGASIRMSYIVVVVTAARPG